MYSSRYMLSINRWDSTEGFFSNWVKNEDFFNVFEEIQFFSQKEYQECLEFNTPEDTARRIAYKKTYRLKSEVLTWLEENVPDRKLSKFDTESSKGWCTGNNAYNSVNNLNVTLWFQREKDARAFTKRWSKHGKFSEYYNYFTGTRKKINEQGKLVIVQRE